MRQHLVIWTVAVIVLSGAIGYGALKVWIRDHNSVVQGFPDAQDAIAEALVLVDKDRSLYKAETQKALRNAAVLSQIEGLSTAEAAYVIALQYQRERNLSGAETYFKKTIKLRPEWSAPRTALGWLVGIHTLGRREEAIEILDEAIRLNTEDTRPHIALTIIYRVAGQLDNAEKHAREALRIDPDTVTSHNNYANVMIRKKDYEEAEKHYRLALDIEPGHVKPMYNLACLYSITGRKEDALRYLAEVCAMDPAYQQDAVDDHDLDGIRDEPEFKRIVYGE